MSVQPHIHKTCTPRYFLELAAEVMWVSAKLKDLERDGLIGWAKEHFQDVTGGKVLVK